MICNLDLDYINTANAYSDGTSEEIVGKFLDTVSGGDVVVATAFALKLNLSEDEMAMLEAPYIPHGITGHALKLD